ncbi:MAG: cell division protein ZapA [Proteobacteria bacterium]|nr:cell division protein ZapA [Pseudomonadota bacterium]
MKSDNTGVNVNILGKQFMVACPDEERQSLSAAAQFLDEKMREIQNSGRVVGSERCAVMAALNITNDLLQLQDGSGLTDDAAKRLRSIQDKIDSVLQQ